MNRQQKIMIIVLSVLLVVVIGLLIFLNLGKNTGGDAGGATATPEIEASEEPYEDPLAGMTEEEIARMAMEEESEEDYTNFEDEDDTPLNTDEPID